MKRLHIKWAFVIAWMIMIFVLSHQPATISDGNSQFIIKIFKTLGINLDSAFGDLANFAVRKSAHFLEYLIFSLLIYNASRETYSISKSIFLAVGLVFFYACTDEIHQLFVKGRSGRFRDVMIDTSGGATAMLSVCLLSFTKAASLLKKNSN
ncbi:MAG: VanZ family protein [Clostridiaceae bacterium]|nr:VanZ family protein [Clostridiaceae bacterium]